MRIKEPPTTNETVYTTTNKDVVNFDSIWNYNCGAISDQASILTTFLATEPLTIRFSHICPINSTLIPFWVNNASEYCNITSHDTSRVLFTNLID